MSDTNICVQSAPRRFMSNDHNQKAVVVTFVWRDMSLKERCFFRQSVKILGRHPFCVVHPKSYSVDYLKQEFPEISSLALDDCHFQSVWTYNDMMLSPWFYDLFSDFEYMLICQTDAYVFSDQLDYWVSLGYDYVGAPWMLNDKPYERFIGQWVIRLLQKQPIRNNHLHSAHLFHHVGNGGFCLRRISKMKEILERNQDLVHSAHGKHEKMEDVFISIILKAKENLNVPHWKKALYFSFEKAPAWCLKLTKGVFPFGCHDTNARYWDSFWKYHIPLEESTTAEKAKKKQIIHLISNKEWGGGEQYAYDLCHHLQADGYDVKIVCRPIQQLIDRLQVLDLPMAYMALGGITDWLSVWRLSRMLKNGNNIVHVHNFKDAKTAALARMLSSNRQNIRIVITRHLVKKGKNNCIYQWLYRQISSIVFVSELARNEFFLGHPSVDRKKTCVIRNSTKLLENSVQIDVREKFNINKDTIIMMYHGRMVEEKGLSVLIDALRYVDGPNYVLFLLGTGDASYMKKLRKQTEHYKLSDHVIFAGYHFDVLPYIAQCDFGIIPSIVRESSSLSSMEYMSMGKCVITTNNGGQAEYIENGKNSILVNPNDSKQLAECINDLIKNRSLRERLGQQAKHDYKAYMSYEHFFEKIKIVYGG